MNVFNIQLKELGADLYPKFGFWPSIGEGKFFKIQTVV